MAKKKGFFLVLEGIDKCGKSTQAKMLASLFHRKGLKVLHTREPGGSSLGEKIRKLILRSPGFVSDRAELLLYEASRAQHVEEKILPALKRGRLVLCERFSLATLAYQGCGRGFSKPQIQWLNNFASFGIKPDLTIVLDIGVKEFKKRAGRFLDRMESKASFLERVRLGYLKLVNRRDCLLVDARQDPQSLHEVLSELLKDYGLL